MGRIDFNEVLLEQVNEKLGPGEKGVIRTVRKNNAVVLDAIVISEEGGLPAPTIYLGDYKRRYEMDEESLESIVDDVLRKYKKSKMDASTWAGEICSWMQDWEIAKKKVVCRMINEKMNRELLFDVPNKLFLDLAVVFSLLIPTANGESASCLIHNSLANMWGVGDKELMEAAKENMERLLPVAVDSMAGVLAEACGEEMIPEEAMPMLVITNADKAYGASSILYGEALEKASKKVDDDLVLIPSSVHEWLAIPRSLCGEVKEMCAMIREVNETQVPEDEVLSDHPYVYYRESKGVYIA